MSKRKSPEQSDIKSQYPADLLSKSEAAFKKLGKKISVIGIGKLGLCFALSAAKIGYDVVGVDIFPDYIKQLNAKKYNTKEPKVVEYLTEAVDQGRFRATCDMKDAVEHSDIIFILVATPTVGGRHMYDHSNLGKVLAKLNAFKFSNKHLVISSTVMPGYIRKVGRPLMADCPGTTVSYNPAFVAQGEVMKGYATGGFFGLVLVGGDDEEIYHYLARIYIDLAASANTTVNVAKLTPESAEIAKISSNCFRTMKIAYANMIGDICDATDGADKNEVCAALMKDDSIGAKCMRPGFGFGGPCYPRDNQALALYAESVGVNAVLSKASNESNQWHAHHQAKELIAQNLPEYEFKQVAYKPNCPVPMIEESQKLRVAELVADAGKKVVIVDVPEVLSQVQQEFGSHFKYRTDAGCAFRSDLPPDELHY